MKPSQPQRSWITKTLAAFMSFSPLLSLALAYATSPAVLYSVVESLEFAVEQCCRLFDTLSTPPYLILLLNAMIVAIATSSMSLPGYIAGISSWSQGAFQKVELVYRTEEECRKSHAKTSAVRTGEGEGEEVRVFDPCNACTRTVSMHGKETKEPMQEEGEEEISVDYSQIYVNPSNDFSLAEFEERKGEEREMKEEVEEISVEYSQIYANPGCDYTPAKSEKEMKEKEEIKGEEREMKEEEKIQGEEREWNEQEEEMSVEYGQLYANPGCDYTPVKSEEENKEKEKIKGEERERELEEEEKNKISVEYGQIYANPSCNYSPVKSEEEIKQKEKMKGEERERKVEEEEKEKISVEYSQLYANPSCDYTPVKYEEGMKEKEEEAGIEYTQIHVNLSFDSSPAKIGEEREKGKRKLGGGVVRRERLKRSESNAEVGNTTASATGFPAPLWKSKTSASLYTHGGEEKEKEKEGVSSTEISLEAGRGFHSQVQMAIAVAKLALRVARCLYVSL